MNAYQAYAAVNGTRLACAMRLLTVAPALPAALPPVLLEAAAGTPNNTTANNTAVANLPFTLALTVPSYIGRIQVYAAPPLLSRQAPQAGAKAVIIANLSVFTHGSADLAPAYAARFGPLVPGQQVVLSLVPVSSEGFRGNPLSVAADVQSPSQTARTEGDTQSSPLTLKTA